MVYFDPEEPESTYISVEDTWFSWYVTVKNMTQLKLHEHWQSAGQQFVLPLQVHFGSQHFFAGLHLLQLHPGLHLAVCLAHSLPHLQLVVQLQFKPAQLVLHLHWQSLLQLQFLFPVHLHLSPQHLCLAHSLPHLQPTVHLQFKPAQLVLHLH